MIARTLLALFLIWLVGVACAIANAAQLEVVLPAGCDAAQLQTIAKGKQRLVVTCGQPKAQAAPANAPGSPAAAPAPKISSQHDGLQSAPSGAK